jgi:multiple sugar transport system substrate-binding protein
MVGGGALKPGPAILALTLLFSCSGAREDGIVHLEMWGLGREGQVVAELMPEFHRRNPDIRVSVQQIPWTAAHEKLLTAHVGNATPDIAQLGNTWIPEFVTIRALEDLTPFVSRSVSLSPGDFFDGIWATNTIGDDVYGIPWYVDTRLLFYRTDILASVGFEAPPRTWDEWTEVMQRLVAQRRGVNRFPILLPTNEWSQPVLLALQQDSTLLTEDGSHGAFRQAEFRKAFEFYVGLFRQGYAPVLSNSQVANVYQQFESGDFAMYITGPWNIGEFRRRLSTSMEGKWSTAAMPAPAGKSYPGTSLAGGASLVMFNRSERKGAAWKLIEYLSEPAQQIRFYELTGSLPANEGAWEAPALASDALAAAFRTQLENVTPTPKVAEWEQIATIVWEAAESAIRGERTIDAALERLDARTDRILEKRRWVVQQNEGTNGE